MPDRATPFVADLAWDEVARRLAAGSDAILPVGAAAKQHGLHLPMATDRVQAEYFARELALAIGALVWPTLTYGAYPAFVAYPGSVSLSDATFENVVAEIVDGLLGAGARRVLILDTGLSTGAPIGAAVARTRAPGRVRHLAVYRGADFQAAARAIASQPHGSHADEIETSLMLAIAPGVVDMARTVASPPLARAPEPGPLTPDDPASPNFAPSGSFGDPTLATPDKGFRLRDAILADLIAGAAA